MGTVIVSLTLIRTLPIKTATACASTKDVLNNVCTACPSGHTCNGATPTPCASTKYVQNNVCTACPSGVQICGSSTGQCATWCKLLPVPWIVKCAWRHADRDACPKCAIRCEGWCEKNDYPWH